MRIAGIGRLQQVFRWFRNTIDPPALILMYHRVAEKALDPWLLCVTPGHFANHMEVLQKRAHPISLTELVHGHQAGRIPERAVAVTFDDGYADNLHHAKPILERYSIPATVFVISGCIGKSQEFWWDELEHVLLQPGRLPEKLRLRINGTMREWTLGAAVDYNEAECQSDYDHYAPTAEPGTRLSFYHSVWQKLQPLPDEQLREALDEIWAWANVTPKARLTHRPLDSQELRTLEQGGLVEVAAHTVTHPLLSAHLVTFQRHEIWQSKADLEKLLDHPVTSFSYPHGLFTEDTIGLVRDAGFICACSDCGDTVRNDSSLFQLPRFQVKNWNKEEFEIQLSKWFEKT